MRRIAHQRSYEQHTPKMYIDDDERSLLSMKDLRVHKKVSLWKRAGGLTTLVMVAVGIAVGFTMGFDEARSQQSQKQLDDLLLGNRGSAKYSPTTTPLELLGFVRKTRRNLLVKLVEDYGEYVTALTDKSSLYSVFRVKEGSKSRYRRRILQKILAKQINPKERVVFRWVTAGDESAAGYGNDPEQSYTHVLHDTVRDAFESVGVEFEVHNRAMEGFGSAPAVALCMPQLFGDSIDVLSWDFSALDGDRHYRAALWGIRATLHPTRPLLLMMDSFRGGRYRQLARMDGKLGVALLDDGGLHNLVGQQFPDSTRITHPEQLPPALQYLQCDGHLEGHELCNDRDAHGKCNDPKGDLCRQYKFLQNDSCQVNKYQVAWIPGW